MPGVPAQESWRLVPGWSTLRVGARDALLRALDAGFTGYLEGCLPDGEPVAAYVMTGEVLAARTDEDDRRLLDRVAARGRVSAERVDLLRRAVDNGASLVSLLEGDVSEAELSAMLFERFRQNLFDFLVSPREVTTTELDAVFVDNIQVGHDSPGLVAELWALAEELGAFGGDASRRVWPAAGTITSNDEILLVELCAARPTVAELLRVSPFEAARTLELLRRMLLAGSLATDHALERRGEPTGPEPATLPDPVTAPGSGRSAGPSRAAPPPAAPEAPAPAPVPRPTPSAPARAPSRQPDPTSAEATAPRPVAPVRRPTPEREDDHTEEVSRDPATLPPRARKPAPAASPPPAKPRRALPEALANFYAHESSEEDLSAFGDYDAGRGEGAYVGDQLDRVNLHGGTVETVEPQEREIEMGEADAAAAAAQKTININFSGPRLRADEAEHKVRVVSELLEAVVTALDEELGSGEGAARVQVLLEGTSGAYAALFARIELGAHGRLPVDRVLKNLRKRSAPEQRNLLNSGLLDVADRALQLASSSLSDEGLDALLERVAGFQSRFGI